MSILDRVLGRTTTPTLERPPTRQESEERVVGIAHRIIPATHELTHFFICSGNRSVIESCHGLFQVGAAAYGGTAALYHADGATLGSRRADAEGQALRFHGQRSIGRHEEAVADVADVLGSLGTETVGGAAFIAHVTVGPTGTAWVRDVYTTIMDEAMRQGILPFRMFETADADAAAFLLASLARLSAA